MITCYGSQQDFHLYAPTSEFSEVVTRHGFFSILQIDTGFSCHWQILDKPVTYRLTKEPKKFNFSEDVTISISFGEDHIQYVYFFRVFVHLWYIELNFSNKYIRTHLDL